MKRYDNIEPERLAVFVESDFHEVKDGSSLHVSAVDVNKEQYIRGSITAPSWHKVGQNSFYVRELNRRDSIEYYIVKVFDALIDDGYLVKDNDGDIITHIRLDGGNDKHLRISYTELSSGVQGSTLTDANSLVSRYVMATVGREYVGSPKLHVALAVPYEAYRQPVAKFFSIPL